LTISSLKCDERLENVTHGRMLALGIRICCKAQTGSYQFTNIQRQI